MKKSIQLEIEKEKRNQQIAEEKGWTDIHGGIGEGGLYLRGYPPGVTRGLMVPVPDFTVATEKPESGLRWHCLSMIRMGGDIMECMGATCIDGIGVIVYWKLTPNGWTKSAIDTESGTWAEMLDSGEEDDEIPETPLHIDWDDRN